MSDLIQVRRGTSAEWAAANPVLASGEPGYDTTTGDYKIGNGVTAWASLVARYVTVPTAWVTPTLLNSWVDFGGAFQGAQYRKRGDVVEMRGRVKTGAIGTVIFTLPAGFCPPADLMLVTDSNNAMGNMWIKLNGDVVANVGNTATFTLQAAFSVTA